MKTFAVLSLLLALAFGSLYDESGEYEPNTSPTATCACGYTHPRRLKGRVVGGKDTLVNEYPLIGALIYSDDPSTVFCGSTIITKKHTVTAAHCKPKEPRSVTVVLGDYDIESATETKTVSIDVKDFISHQYFNESGHRENDIALLLLAEEIPFGPTIGPACFPQETFRPLGRTVRIIGWGSMYYDGPQSNILQKVDVQVRSISSCASVYKGITRSQLCTYTTDRDACQGDSGGPVIYQDPATKKYMVVGVVSYGIGCAEADTPGVNTNIVSYRDWILQTIAQSDPTSTICENN